MGQLQCEVNHMSMHSTWKAWPHFGNLLPISPSSITLKQTTHSNSSVFSALCSNVGIAETVAESRPLVHVGVASMLMLWKWEGSRTPETVTGVRHRRVWERNCDWDKNHLAYTWSRRTKRMTRSKERMAASMMLLLLSENTFWASWLSELLGDSGWVAIEGSEGWEWSRCGLLEWAKG